MGIIELFFVAIGLAMDAFAVSVCKGLGIRRIDRRHALVIALFFGAFQGIMPVIGWVLGTGFAALIEPVDHWVAFILLACIGGKMIWDGAHEGDPCEGCADGVASAKLDLKELFLLAIATSIDALAVGITLAFLGADVWLSAGIIALVTFALSYLGVELGNRIGARFNRPATVIGGIVLVLIGLRILLEHLGIFG